MEDLEKILSVLKDVSVDDTINHPMSTLYRNKLYQIKTQVQVTEFYDNGEKYIEYTVNSDNKKHGLCQSWHKNGQKSCEINWVNGKEHGLSQGWYDNGQKSWELNYVDDKLDGLFQSWHKNGQKSCERNWVNGKEHGLSQHWHENGQCLIEMLLGNGNKKTIKRKRGRPSKYGDDPIAYYNEHYSGLTRGELSKENSSLYQRLWRDQLLGFVPLKARGKRK